MNKVDVMENLGVKEVEGFDKYLTYKAREVYRNKIPRTLHSYQDAKGVYKVSPALYLGKLFPTTKLEKDPIPEVYKKKVAEAFNKLVEADIVGFGVIANALYIPSTMKASQESGMILLYTFYKPDINVKDIDKAVNEFLGEEFAIPEGGMPSK